MPHLCAPFFFSSRRRHTRFSRDWSSDVCSSDLGRKTDTLRDFETGIAELADGERAPVRYMTIDDPNNSELRAIRMDRLWFPARHCDRDDASGLWDCQPLAAGPQPKPVPESSTVFPHFKDPRLNALAPSLAMVKIGRAHV